MIKDYILASGSIYRKQLLERAGLSPAKIITADIDETPDADEKPTDYVKRMALEKAQAVHDKNADLPVLAADTIVVCHDQIIQKAKSTEEQKRIMQCLSGSTHHVLTAVCLILQDGKVFADLSDTAVTVKALSDNEIDLYVQSGDWKGCCGYHIEGVMESFTIGLNGSYSGILGLPLCLVRSLFQKTNLLSEK